MSPLLSGAIVFTLGCYGAASLMVLIRLVRGPRAQDRVFALDILYLHAILILLVLGLLHQSDRYFEAALVIAVFSVVSSSALAKFILRGEVIE